MVFCDPISLIHHSLIFYILFGIFLVQLKQYNLFGWWKEIEREKIKRKNQEKRNWIEKNIFLSVFRWVKNELKKKIFVVQKNKKKIQLFSICLFSFLDAPNLSFSLLSNSLLAPHAIFLSLDGFLHSRDKKNIREKAAEASPHNFSLFSIFFHLSNGENCKIIPFCVYMVYRKSWHSKNCVERVHWWTLYYLPLNKIYNRSMLYICYQQLEAQANTRLSKISFRKIYIIRT